MELTPGEQRMAILNGRLTYKPGYLLSIGINPGGNFYNSVMTFYAPDSNNPNEKRLTYHKNVLGLKADVDTWSDEQICLKLKEIILQGEEHEICEWLQIDGRKPLDPHKGET